MKRLAVLVLFVLLAAGTAAAADRLLIGVGLNYMLPSDAGYRDIYGDRVFYPEAWAGVRVFRGFHLLGGYGGFTKKGTTPELGLEAKSTQRVFWAGLGYVGTVTRLVQFKAEAGAASVGYKEESMGVAVSGSRLGLRAGFGLLFLGRVLFTGLDLGYIGASDSVEDVKIKLGGFKGFVSIGVRL